MAVGVFLFPFSPVPWTPGALLYSFKPVLQILRTWHTSLVTLSLYSSSNPDQWSNRVVLPTGNSHCMGAQEGLMENANQPHGFSGVGELFTKATSRMRVNQGSCWLRNRCHLQRSLWASHLSVTVPLHTATSRDHKAFLIPVVDGRRSRVDGLALEFQKTVP